MVDEPAYKVAFKFRRVLVPITPQERSREAIEVAADFYRRYGSSIVFFYASENPDRDVPLIEEMLRRYARDIVYDLRLRRIESGETAASAIVDEAVKGLYDLVLLESRGYTGVEALLYNSTSVAVALAVPASVLILR